MHDAQERASFTLSPLNGFVQNHKERTIRFTTGDAGWLRITLLDDQLADAFYQHLLRQTLPAIRLGEMHLGIASVFGAPGSHPWSGFTTVDALRALNHPHTEWAVEFASPTAIRWGDADNGARRIEFFPLPRMAIAGLRTRWDRLTGESWGRPFEEWVERNIVINQIWHWHTESFAFQKQSYRGGVGRLQYRLLDDRTPQNAAHFDRLLHLAFYAGIGYKTTHGLGQVRLLTPE
jgi:CRISPR-associated endoribonuclease Cas6